MPVCACKHCGTDFRRRAPGQVYCRPECREAALPGQVRRGFGCVPCPLGCGRCSRRLGVACSQCRDRRTPSPVTCRTCRTAFVPSRTRRHYCSPACYRAGQGHAARLRRQEAPDDLCTSTVSGPRPPDLEDRIALYAARADRREPLFQGEKCPRPSESTPLTATRPPAGCC